MADNKDIEIRVKVDTSDVEKGLKDVEKASINMAKKVEKSGDKAEKSFNVMERTLKNTKKQMENLTKNVNFNNLANSMKKALSNITQQVSNTTRQVKNQLQEALNLKANVEINAKTTTDKSSGAGSSLGTTALAGGAVASAGAMGSQIAEELSQGMEQGMSKVQEVFSGALQGMKSEAETLSMVFDGIDDSLIQQMDNIKKHSEKTLNRINELNQKAYKVRNGSLDGFVPQSVIDYGKALDKASEQIKNVKERLLEIKKTGIVPDDLSKLQTGINRALLGAKTLGLELSETEQQMRKLTSPLSKETLNIDQLQQALNMVQRIDSEVISLQSDIAKINFINNFDTTKLISSLEQFEQAQTKANAQPLIDELQRMQQEANKAGISIKGVDDVLQQYSQIDANATKLTAEFRNALIGVCQQFKDYNSQVLANEKAQNLLAQRQKEIASRQTEFGKALVKSKHVLQDFSNGVKQAFSKSASDINKMKQSIKDWANKHKQATDKVKKANNGVANSFKGLIKSMLPFLTLYGAFNLIKSSVTESMDAIETGSKFSAIFGNETKDMSKWVKEVSKDLGLSTTNMKNYTSTMYSMGKNLGMTGEQAKTMSKDLSMLAQDMASFYNISDVDAFDKLKSYMSGSSEVLYEFGVVATEANLQTFALSQGITKSYSAMSQAEKSMLRYQYAMQGLSAASGDLARTLEFGASYGNI